MRKSWIIIELTNGRQVKYVSRYIPYLHTLWADSRRSGMQASAYYYGLTPADSLIIQSDTYGKILFDYNYLITSWRRATADNTERLLMFPERADTKFPSYMKNGDSILVRPDYSITQGYAFELQSNPFWGDTGITRNPALTYQRIGIHAIQNIIIIDQPFVGDTWKHY
jgi:hypothetical protein